jgi:hypothetical protein
VTGPLERLDASRYGDPEGQPAGVGPPCESCGEREAVENLDLGDREVALCGPCILEADESGD